MGLHNQQTQAIKKSFVLPLITIAFIFSGQAALSASANTSNLEPVREALRKKEFSKAMAILTPLAQKSQADAEYVLGVFFKNGIGTDVDLIKSEQWLKRAAEHGNTDAAYILASDLPTEQSEDIQHWLEIAANQGDTRAKTAMEKGIKPYQFQPEKFLTDATLRHTVFFQAAKNNDADLLETIEDQQLIQSTDEFGRGALAYATQEGALSATTILINSGANLNQSDLYGITPLMLASANGNISVVDALIKNGANTNTQDNSGNTALMYAVAKNHLDIIEQLIDSGADTKKINKQNWSAIDWAIHTNNNVIAKYLQAQGLTSSNKAIITSSAPSIPLQHAPSNDLYLNWPDLLIASSRSSTLLLDQLMKTIPNTAIPELSGQNPILTAVKTGNPTTVEKLLMAGISPNSKNSLAETPLSWATRHNQLSIVQLLLSHGANPNLHGSAEQAPIFDAVKQNNVSILTALLLAKVDTEERDSIGRTPAMLAVIKNKHALLRALLSSININSTDKEGRTVLWHAAASGSNDCVNLLANYKDILDKGDLRKTTPLMAASARGHDAVITSLLRAGASQNQSTDQVTALMLAAGNGHDTSVRLLIASGAKLDVQNNQGDTALIFAVRNGHASTARMLLAAKADLDLRNLDRASAKDIAEKLGDNNMVSLLTQRS